ncbi:MAG: putative MAPEG superfamily protein [Paraglaciecola sp.]|jgi:uncharacterized MAPEG superfamily protein
MNATILAVLGYLTWTLTLVVVIAIYRTQLVMRNEREPNGFKADGSDSPPFGQRLARAFGNCVESFAFVGGTMLLALATDASAITNGLAYLVLAARLGQSLIHIASTSVPAVQLRFAFFLVQVGICFYWIVLMAQKFIG